MNTCNGFMAALMFCFSSGNNNKWRQESLLSFISILVTLGIGSGYDLVVVVLSRRRPPVTVGKYLKLEGMKENIPNTNINIIIVFSTEGQLFVTCNLVTNFIVLKLIVWQIMWLFYIKLTLIPSFHKYLAFQKYSFTVYQSHQRILYVQCHYKVRSILHTYSVLRETLKAFNHAVKMSKNRDIPFHFNIFRVKCWLFHVPKHIQRTILSLMIQYVRVTSF